MLHVEDSNSSSSSSSRVVAVVVIVVVGEILYQYQVNTQLFTVKSAYSL